MPAGKCISVHLPKIFPNPSRLLAILAIGLLFGGAGVGDTVLLVFAKPADTDVAEREKIPCLYDLRSSIEWPGNRTWSGRQDGFGREDGSGSRDCRGRGSILVGWASEEAEQGTDFVTRTAEEAGKRPLTSLDWPAGFVDSAQEEPERPSQAGSEAMPANKGSGGASDKPPLHDPAAQPPIEKPSSTGAPNEKPSLSSSTQEKSSPSRSEEKPSVLACPKEQPSTASTLQELQEKPSSSSPEEKPLSSVPAKEKPSPSGNEKQEPEASPGAGISPDQIARWIEQLGHESYQVREQASAELARAGLLAAEALKAALRHPDLEVRRRARWILTQVLEADHRQRLEKFLADPTGSPDHPLPLWRRYRELVGFDEGARKLFAAMQRAEGPLLEAVEQGGSGAVESVRARLQQIIQRTQMPSPIPYQPSLGTSVAFLFVSSLPELDLPVDVAETRYIYNLVHQQGFQQVLTGPDTPERQAARRLLGLWILRPLGPQAIQTGLVHNRLQLALQHRMPEGLVLAVEILQAKEKAKPHGYMYAQAVCALGLLGGKTYAEHLTPLLEENHECVRIGINNKQCSIQVRDVALAWLVHLTDQKHADYGMPDAAQEFERLRQIQQYFPNFTAFRYGEEANREEAIKKFKAWLAEHPLPKAPELPKRPVAPKPAKEKSAQTGRFHFPLAAQAPQPNQAMNQPAQPGSEAGQGKSKFFLPRADRLLVRSLGQAQDAIQQGRFGEAVRILGDILAAQEDYAFQPEPGEPLYRTVKSEAMRLLAQMPAEGLQTYQTLYEARARELLREALADRNLNILEATADRFFFTRAGAEALGLLSRALLDRNQPVQAALAARRLAEHPLAEELEPIRSLLEAVGWYRAGERAAAQAALARLLPQWQGKTVVVAGREEKLFFQSADPLRWLQTKLGLPGLEQAPGGWLFVHANPAHNRSAELGLPYLQPVAHWSGAEEPLLANLLQQLRRRLHEELRPALVQLHPLVVGGKVVFYTPTRLRAVDLQTGQSAWEAPLEDPLRLFLQPYSPLRSTGRPADSQAKTSPPSEGPQQSKAGRILAGVLARQLGISSASPLPQPELDQSSLSADRLPEILAEGLQERFWGETGFGLLSSDGQRIYGLEDTPFRFPVQFQRVVVTADGRRRPEPYLQKNYNLLVAYDLRTGKAVWELGGPLDVDSMQLAGTYFLGPPIPLGGRLYVAALREEQTQLLELDAQTGQLLGQVPLSSKQPEPPSQRAMFMAMGIPIDRLRQTDVPMCLPAYADGILVCRTAENHYVGVDLLRRTIRWIYEAGQEEEELAGPAVLFGIMPVALRRAYAAWKQQDDRWLEAGITIGQGHVVLTAPESNKLLCLRLADGHRLWTAPRRDGLFVGTLTEDKVVVVGRESIWALRLQDGLPAWASGAVALPAGALPAGRGYRQGRFFYLPLSSAEVAAFDVEAGRLVARSRSPQGIIPGNLVACNGVILSQDVDGLYRWEILEDRLRQTAARLAQSPNQPQAVLEHAEAMLAQGHWDRSLELLQQAKSLLGQSAQDQARFRELLAAAAEDGLLMDPQGLLARLPQIEQLWDPGDRQTRLVQLLAQAHQQQGQIEAAFEKYLRLLRLASKPSEEQHRLSTGHTVRLDRWIAARLAELYQQAPPEIRAKLDDKITPWKQPDRWEEFLRYFGFHPAAQQVRLELAQRYQDTGRFLEAEWLLQTVFEQADPVQQRLAAVALAQLYRKAGRHEAAAGVYRLLGGPWAELICAEGKTGRQLLEALPPEDPVRKLLAAQNPWPTDPPKVETLSGNRGHKFVGFVSVVRTSSLTPPLAFRFDPNPSQLEIGHPSGKKTEPIGIPRPPTMAAINHNVYSYCQGVHRGHVLIGWLGTVVAGVNLLSEPGQILWTQPTVPARQPPHPLLGGGVFGVRVQPRVPGPFLADQPLPLMVSTHTICFQQDRKLTAVEPLGGGGTPLWTRTDLPENADLFGDEEVLFVTPAGQQEATVLSTLDGRRLGTRRVPDIKGRLLVLGRRVLCWKSDQQTSEAFLVDPWKDQTLWTRTFPAKSQPWLLTDEGRLAVLAPSGALVLVDVETGQEVLQASVDPEPNLDSLVVLALESRYIVIANRPFQPTGPVFFGRQMFDALPVHGRVTALDRRSGQVLWNTEVLEQTIRLGCPTQLPILVFYNIGYRQTQNPRGDVTNQPWENLLCLDVRTGTVIHQSNKMGIAGFGYEITANPEERTISIIAPRETVRLRFGSP